MRGPVITGRSAIHADLRRREIVHAARALVVQRGFRGTQMSEVAKKAGVAPNTLYRLYPSKKALLTRVIKLVTEYELDILRDAAQEPGPPLKRLTKIAWLFASRAVRAKKMAHALLLESVEADLDETRRRAWRPFATEFKNVIEEGIRTGGFPDQDAETAAACVIGSLLQGLGGPLSLTNSATTDTRLDQAEKVVKFCVRGVSGATHIKIPRGTGPWWPEGKPLIDQRD